MNSDYLGKDGTPAWAYDEDGYCVCCGNGRWKYHMPGCQLRDALSTPIGRDASVADLVDALREEGGEIVEGRLALYVGGLLERPGADGDRYLIFLHGRDK